MFERLMVRAAARAEARAGRRRTELAERVRAAAPAGVAVTVEGEAVVLEGRGLSGRMASDPALRWIVAENRDG